MLGQTQPARQATNRVNLFDVCIVGGFLAFMGGVWWRFSPAWALIIGGAMLLVFGLWGSIGRG